MHSDMSAVPHPLIHVHTLDSSAVRGRWPTLSKGHMIEPRVYKVIHAQGSVETVYLVSAISAREAETEVIDSLYDRTHKIEWSPEELANDTFGLKLSTGTCTNFAMCKKHGCSVNAVLFVPDPPYKLYTLDTSTGVLT